MVREIDEGELARARREQSERRYKQGKMDKREQIRQQSILGGGTVKRPVEVQVERRVKEEAKGKRREEKG